MKKYIFSTMNLRFIPLALAGVASLMATAEKIDISSMKYSGPFAINAPVMIDSVDVNSKKFDVASLLKTPLSLSAANKGTARDGAIVLRSDGNALHLLNFTIDNERYATATLHVDSLKNYEVYLDGKKLDGDKLVLTPATHEVTIKCLTDGAGDGEAVAVSIDTERPELLKINSSDLRRITLNDILIGKGYSAISLSPSGKYMVTTYYYTHDGGSNTFTNEVRDMASGRTIAKRSESLHWMPKSDLLYYLRIVNGKRQIMTINPVSGEEKLLVDNVPSSYFTIAPTEDYLIYSKRNEGPKEKSADLYEIVHPEDRQPGWRNRGALMKMDFATGMSTPLTFGNRNVGLCNISDDGSKLLYRVSESRLEKRPTTLSSYYLLNLADNSTRCVIDKDGFIGAAYLSPDGNKVAILASPDALDGVGRNLPEGRIASMYDNQLLMLDIASGKITPMTLDFNPTVETIEWGRGDNSIYFIGEDRDRRSLFRINLSNGKIDNLNAQEENVGSFSLAANSPTLIYNGQGAMNTSRLYSLNTKNLRHNMIEDLSAERLDGIKIGECKAWTYVTSRGDSICARYVLPPDFDPERKYPMIVNYYGGCNPTTRSFESRYPHQVYAANGYVVLVINPSGCTGFGQEFSSRHVNTAGEGVAEDIIEGVKQFTAANPWVDAAKIGCIGASYGGFMTQYLQTKTDIFAAAISHAGISDHTSYWGEGYWGYSYSEVSMANSYPWSEPDLYVKRSPLYNAHKIHTPILFLHGDADTNVPFGESIQMYTALKLLGNETAFVAVKDTNHQVTDFKKRQQWQETIFAWFAKYLQDDPSWWESLYPAKTLD
ncbi:MAG: prolyl oligopeptidase family serine peptidase [Staphylococcus sp.]|nr:prolyl oligopeptidase family serine peptidase [Staphylococcus sp.]